MSNVEVSYREINGNTTILGTGSNPNTVGELIYKSFPSVDEALHKGVFYFKINEGNPLPYFTSTTKDLGDMVQNMFVALSAG
jgi:hypothetical protein